MTTSFASKATALLTRDLDREAGDTFQRYATAFFEKGRHIAVEARNMPFEEGARLLMIQLRSQPEMAREALVLAMLAEMQEAARQPA